MPAAISLPRIQLLLLGFIALSFSCKRNDSSVLLKTINDGLETSNRTIGTFTNTLLHQLENKQNEPASRERALRWYPIASRIHSISDSAYNYIKALNKKDHLTDVEIRELYNYGKKYKQRLLSIDQELTEIFKSELSFIFKKFGETTADSITFRSKYLRAKPDIDRKLILTKIQNDILSNENNMVYQCNNMCTGIIEDFYYYSVMIGQNSNILKPGDKLELRAGIGAFSKAAQPTITIDGRVISLGEEGFSFYKRNVQNNPGTYHIPVKISYLNQITGKNEVLETEIEYTVAKPCDQ